MGCAVLVVLAVSAGAWWGRPRLGEGSLVAPGTGMSWANDGVEDTRMIVRGKPAATVTATFSIRNDGRLPFTVTGADRSDAGVWLSRQQVTFIPGLPVDGPDPTPVRQVTVEPGDEARLVWSLDMRCQPPLADGAFMSVEAIPLTVSTWGVPASRELVLERPITFAGDTTTTTMLPGDCAGD
ncbi:hypothetical protein [Actinoplanes sp. NPDC026670]|uniref:hypothetical protein n=1 Tax=Actinoplanes sp. NPDC026670 TaxID=3154700 RepID=UPI0033ECDBD8